MAQITIQSGAIVQRDDGKMVTLLGTVYADAERKADGGYLYSCDGRQYYSCASVCQVRAEPESHNYAYRHEDGLVWMV